MSQPILNCSDAEWQARIDLAALFRILAHYNMSDLANGAVAARVPDQRVARYQDQMAKSDHYNYNGETEWAGLIRLLNKRSPDYKEPDYKE